MMITYFPPLLFSSLLSTKQDWLSIAQDFEQKWQFPNCLGAIDGKHIAITPPPETGSYYYNYKGFNSMVLLAVANANYEFVYASFGTNGRVSDGGSLIRLSFMTNSLTVPFRFQNLARSMGCPMFL